ncbi:hypothetical protein ES705_25246 [subsurface metagenome]
MPVFLANLLRILMIGSVGYSVSDIVDWLQLRKTGEEPTVGETLKQVFLSWRFFLFLGVLVFGFYILLKDRFKKTTS